MTDCGSRVPSPSRHSSHSSSFILCFWGLHVRTPFCLSQAMLGCRCWRCCKWGGVCELGGRWRLCKLDRRERQGTGDADRRQRGLQLSSCGRECGQLRFAGTHKAHRSHRYAWSAPSDTARCSARYPWGPTPRMGATRHTVVLIADVHGPAKGKTSKHCSREAGCSLGQAQKLRVSHGASTGSMHE